MVVVVVTIVIIVTIVIDAIVTVHNDKYWQK